jgi:hypothetical protein
MGKILVICGNRDRQGELMNILKQHAADVKCYDRTSDLNGTVAHNIEGVDLILLSLAGEADAPWDLWVLRHRFCTPIVVELDVDTPERAYNMLIWGAYDIFTGDEDVWDVITRVINSQ